MKIWREGEATRAICPSCKRRTDVVFQRRTVELEDPDVSIPDVLAAVCRECDEIAMIPNQSTPRLKAGLEKATTTVNARIPGHLEDVLFLLAEQAAPTAKHPAAAVLRFLLSEFVDDREFASRVKQHLAGDLVDGPADHDLSIRVPAKLVLDVDYAAERVGIASRTDVIKGLLATAKEDLLDGANLELGRVMRRALAAVG